MARRRSRSKGLAPNNIMPGGSPRISEGDSLTELVTSHRTIQYPRLGTEALLQSYRTMPWLRAVVGKISKSVATIRWRVFVARDKTGKAYASKALQFGSHQMRERAIAKQFQKDELEELEFHPILDLLERGNEKLLGNTVVEVTQQHLELVGEGFWVIERDVLGTPYALWPVPPNWVKDFPTPDKPWWRVQIGASEWAIPTPDVIAFIDVDPSDPYSRGVGIARALGDELETDEGAAKHTKNYFINGAKPELLVTGETLSRPDTRRLEEDWNNRLKGFKNAHKAYFINRKVDVKEIGTTFRDMTLVDLRKHERDTIIQVFGLPPEKLGLLTNSNRCHDKDTECLTARGWVSHEDLLDSDRVATWNPTTEQVEYHVPDKVLRYQYDGVMHHWNTPRLDIMVTPNHRMWVKTQYKKPWEFRTSESLAGKKTPVRIRCTGGDVVSNCSDQFSIPHVAQKAGQSAPTPSDGTDVWNVPTTAFARWLGAYLADGSVSGADVRISKGSGKAADAISEMCDSMVATGIVKNYTVFEDTREFRNVPLITYRMSSLSLGLWLEKNVGKGAANKKIPECVFTWSSEAQRALLDGYVNGDGGGRKDGTYKDTYAVSVSRELADGIQHICVNVGVRCRVQHKLSSKGFAGKSLDTPASIYHMQFGGNQMYYTSGEAVTPVPYKGTVWCVEVKNGLFFTRRNGVVALTGNSTIGAADFFWTKDIIMPRLDFLRRVLQVKLVPFFDDRIILHYESPVVEDKEHDLNVMKAQPGAFTINEWRALAGLASIGPDGEKFLVESNQKMEDDAGGEESPGESGDDKKESKGLDTAFMKDLVRQQVRELLKG